MIAATARHRLRGPPGACAQHRRSRDQGGPGRRSRGHRLSARAHRRRRGAMRVVPDVSAHTDFVASVRSCPLAAPNVAVRLRGERWSRRSCAGLLLETVEAVENIDEILQVLGIDFLGSAQFDLSTALGVSGQFDVPVFVEAVAVLERAMELEPGFLAGGSCSYPRSPSAPIAEGLPTAVPRLRRVDARGAGADLPDLDVGPTAYDCHAV